MGTLLSGLGNAKTTVAGSVTGISIILWALEQQTLSNKIIGVIAGLSLAALGLFAKDSTTGSQPGSAAPPTSTAQGSAEADEAEKGQE